MTHEMLPRTTDVKAPPRRVLRVMRPVGRFVARHWYDLHVHDAHHVPRQGPVLLVGNHIGLFDGPILTALAPRPVHALVKRQMFDGHGRHFFRAMGQISIERTIVDPYALKRAVRVLRDGRVVAIYPESTRGRGDVTHARLGMAYLALVTGACVIPVAHVGTRVDGESVHAVPPRGRRIDVAFGPPLREPQTPRPWPRRRESVDLLAEELRSGLAGHVHDAVRRLGLALPGEAPDILDDAAGRAGREVGTTTEQEERVT